MSIHEALKAATKPVHDQLERDLDLLRPELTREQYVELLKKFYGFYVSFERALAQDLKINYPYEKKLPALKRDLTRLGVPEEHVDQLPRVEALSLKLSEEQWGALYVIEGSALGGKVLEHHFKKTFGLGPEMGTAFFSGTGEKTMENWRLFLNLLGESSQVLNTDLIIRSAENTFHQLHRWLLRS